VQLWYVLLLTKYSLSTMTTNIYKYVLSRAFVSVQQANGDDVQHVSCSTSDSDIVPIEKLLLTHYTDKISDDRITIYSYPLGDDSVVAPGYEQGDSSCSYDDDSLVDPDFQLSVLNDEVSDEVTDQPTQPDSVVLNDEVSDEVSDQPTQPDSVVLNDVSSEVGGEVSDQSTHPGNVVVSDEVTDQLIQSDIVVVSGEVGGEVIDQLIQSHTVVFSGEFTGEVIDQLIQPDTVVVSGDVTDQSTHPCNVVVSGEAMFVDPTNVVVNREIYSYPLGDDSVVAPGYEQGDSSCSYDDDSLVDPDFQPSDISADSTDDMSSESSDEVCDVKKKRREQVVNNVVVSGEVTDQPTQPDSVVLNDEVSGEVSDQPTQPDSVVLNDEVSDEVTDQPTQPVLNDEVSGEVSDQLTQPDSVVLNDEVSGEVTDQLTVSPRLHGLSLFLKRPRKPGCKQSYDKIHYCKFCGNQIRSKMSRHLLNVHVDETAVREILLMPKGSKERRARLQKLTNEGNFSHNIDVIQKGKGEVVVGKRFANKSAHDYTACEFCKRFESKKNLWRHMKSCAARKEYFGRTGEENARRLLAVKRGTSLVSNAAFATTGEHTKELFDRMRDDEVKSIVVLDKLICREADLRMAALGSKRDWKQDDIYRVSQAARTLGRIVQFARLSMPEATLTKLIEPQCFDLLVDIAKKMSTDKDMPSLNVGRTIGLLLKKVSESKYCIALRTKDVQAQQDATAFKQLLEREWNDRVNRTAIRRMQAEKRMTVQTIPLTHDLQKFRGYLLTQIDQISRQLQQHPRSQDWVLLAKLVLSRLILFNKRRRAEVRELKVSEYLGRPDWKSDLTGEMSLALSPVDRLLADRYNVVALLVYFSCVIFKPVRSRSLN